MLKQYFKNMVVDPRIEKFIAKHNVLTLATAVPNLKGEIEPYCANMFYAYVPETQSFVFTSSDDTRHVSDMLQNNVVAGSVVLESKVVGKLQGLQFGGVISRVENDGERKAYIYRYPFAALSDLNLWVLRLTEMKYTDNTLGFGKKIKWRRNE